MKYLRRIIRTDVGNYTREITRGLSNLCSKLSQDMTEDEDIYYELNFSKAAAPELKALKEALPFFTEGTDRLVYYVCLDKGPNGEPTLRWEGNVKVPAGRVKPQRAYASVICTTLQPAVLEQWEPGRKLLANLKAYQRALYIEKQVQELSERLASKAHAQSYLTHYALHPQSVPPELPDGGNVPALAKLMAELGLKELLLELRMMHGVYA